MSRNLRGIFPVLLTPVDDEGEVLERELEKEVAFCIECGAHGLVFPVLGSEFQFLTEGERRRLVERVVGQAAGQVPVVAGVAGPSLQVAVEMARHAARAGADAVIALPPYIAPASGRQIRRYYEAVARSAGRPVFVQHSAAGMDASFLQSLVEEVEQVEYIKEEMQPSAHQISALVERVGGRCRGIFGGAHGRWMLSELRRGASGFMPAAEAVDVHVQIWEAYQAGDEQQARRIFNRLLPLINQVLLLGLRICKEVMVRRGIFSSSALRMPGGTVPDEEDLRELDAVLADLEPFFRV